MLARTTVLCLGSLGLLATFAAASDAGEGARGKKKRLTVAECERLVKQLVNPDKPPFTKGPLLRLPRGVDEEALREKQAPIRAAYRALSDNIEVALPVLVKHVHDEQFSFVYSDPTSGAISRASIGQACSDIILAHVQVDHRHVMRGDDTGVPRSLWFIHDGCGGIDKWWKSRKGKTLAKLQLEAVEWSLRQKKPWYFESGKEWAEAKKSLEKMARDIRASGKPIKVDHHPPRLEVYK